MVESRRRLTFACYNSIASISVFFLLLLPLIRENKIFSDDREKNKTEREYPKPSIRSFTSASLAEMAELINTQATKKKTVTKMTHRLDSVTEPPPTGMLMQQVKGSTTGEMIETNYFENREWGNGKLFTRVVTVVTTVSSSVVQVVNNPSHSAIRRTGRLVCTHYQRWELLCAAGRRNDATRLTMGQRPFRPNATKYGIFRKKQREI